MNDPNDPMGNWRETARPEQLLPGTEGAANKQADWYRWIIEGDRGTGKSRTAAEAVAELLTETEWKRPPVCALVGRSHDTIEAEMIYPYLLPRLDNVVKSYRNPHSKQRRLTLENGARIQTFTEPDKLRGPIFALAWFDEPTYHPKQHEMWSHLQFALKDSQEGTWTPKLIASVTPIHDPHTVVSTLGSNEANMHPRALEMFRQYENYDLGTRFTPTPWLS